MLPISGTVGNTTLAEGQMPSHSHAYTFAPVNGTVDLGGDGKHRGVDNSYGTSATGGNGAHNHSLSINSLNLNVKYVDLIVASKD